MNADALATLAALAALVIFFYGPWQRICVDTARQIMFEQRDQLFDMARAGLIPFDSPGYQALRESMQRSIRFAHELTMPRMVYLIFMMPSDRKESETQRVMRSVPENQAWNEARKLVAQSSRILVLSVFARSLWVWVALPALIVAIVAAYTFVRVRSIITGYARHAAEIAQREADIYGRYDGRRSHSM